MITQGKWSVSRDKPSFIVDDKGYAICQVITGVKVYDEANAHLIAASPLLYEALQFDYATIIRAFHGKSAEDIIAKIDHALAQAEGRENYGY